jgi:NADH:ubiquinone oxidoreductase subunit 4 (subunit M)
MEITTIPILFIMMDPFHKTDYKKAAIVMLMYAIFECVLISISILILYRSCGTFDITEIYKNGFVNNSLCFWLMFVGIGIKIPVFLLHHWLPRVHVESPTICSVLLASVSLKFSSLIMIRILYHVFFCFLNDYINILCVIYLSGSIIACANIFFQKDLKRIFAYFSILHMNLYSIILLTNGGIKNFTFAVLCHSFIMAALFFATDVLENTLKTRNIDQLKLSNIGCHKLKRIMFVSVLALIGLPPSWSFVSELISVYSVSQISNYFVSIIMFILVLVASYIFFIHQSIFGNFSSSVICKTNRFKLSVFYILFAIILSIGISSGIILGE